MQDVLEYGWLLDAMFDGAYCVDRSRKILYWNTAAEALTGYSREEVQGMNCAADLLHHVDGEGVNLCRGLCPLARTMLVGKAHQTDIFLHHKDGHRIPVTVRCSPLRDAAGHITGAIEIFNDASMLEMLRQRVTELEALAFLDPLTQLANRRYLDIFFKQSLDEWQRYQFPFGLILLDIDHFKRVNDTHGHGMGDQVLRMVGQTLAHSCRSFDVVGRWGGEEFLVITRHIDTDLLASLTERLRALVGASYLTLPSGEKLSVTISAGATLSRADDTPESLLDRADGYLYQSKAGGRNRVTTDTALVAG